eukprot:TRINITY_DN24860_c0_g2_i1.p2 TRINITY_DN24860_c0_g2~~TRINITY_DN24860_c0_g2_i1.p2  ORF type:complete len:350 (+),score=129.56 TRINITY_DN24860_c0_g2_i1:64-1113(+)
MTVLGMLQTAMDALGLRRFARPARSIVEELADLDVYPSGKVPEGNTTGKEIPLVQTTLKEACNIATRRSHFLLVYLHAPDHSDTASFVKNSLCSGEVMQQVLTDYVLWAESAATAEGWAAVQRLRVTGFPFIGLVFPSGQNPLLADVTGNKSAGEIARKLVEWRNTSAAAQLVTLRYEQEQRDQRRQMQEEQEEAFLRAQRADEERFAAKEEQERLQREAEAEAERVRQAVEAEEAARVARERAEEEARLAAVARQREAAAALVAPEPEDGPTTTLLRVTQPDGELLVRRFLKTATVADVCNFVTAHESYDGKKFFLSARYPRKPLDRAGTLESFGLCPRAVVLIIEDE